MNSDGLFWRLVQSRRNVDEAALLWWLMRVGADRAPYQLQASVMKHVWGIPGKRLMRARWGLEADEAIEAGVHHNSYVQARLLGQFVPLSFGISRDDLTHCVDTDTVLADLPFATWTSRIALHRNSREDAILMAWLACASDGDAALLLTTRRLERELGGLVDRRTAMRGLQRLETHGFVSVTPMGRAGTQYRLNRPALEALVRLPCPLGSDAAANIPGWSLHEFPMLAQMNALVVAGAEVSDGRSGLADAANNRAEMAKEIEC